MSQLWKAIGAALNISLAAACAPRSNVETVEPERAASTSDMSPVPTFAFGKCSGSESEREATCNVSMIDLIANPAQFHGRNVAVYGYVHLGFEDNGIYLHKEDLLHNLFRNGLWLSISEGVDVSECHNNYALVVGTFTGGPSGHFGLWSGAIEDVSRCQATAARRGEG